MAVVVEVDVEGVVGGVLGVDTVLVEVVTFSVVTSLMGTRSSSGISLSRRSSARSPSSLSELP